MAHPSRKHLAAGWLETDRERIMQKLRQAAEMLLEVFDNDYGQMAKDIAISDLRQALHDKEITLAPKDVAAIIEDMPQGMDADAFLVELANRAAATERERCAKIALSGTGLPVQAATLKILTKERERIAAAIFEMDKDL